MTDFLLTSSSSLAKRKLGYFFDAREVYFNQ